MAHRTTHHIEHDNVLRERGHSIGAQCLTASEKKQSRKRLSGATTKFSVMGRLAFCWVVFAVLLLLVVTSSAFAPTSLLNRREQISLRLSMRVWANKNENDNKTKYKDSNEKLIDDMLEIERLAAENKPPRIFEAISKTFWAILGLGLLLNAFGYGYVVNKDEWSIKIDTLENKDFQQELVKASKNR